MRVVFMGTPDYATAILKSLIDDSEIEVIALYCQPDKPVGRKQILTPPHTKQYLLDSQSDISIHQPERLRDESVIQALKAIRPDFIVVAAYGQILPQEILDICPCINLHASLLPHYRGASPIQESLLHGDSMTGVTAMWMDVGLDTGDILGFSCVPVNEKTMVAELFETLASTASALTLKILKEWEKILPLPQQECDSSHCRKIKKEYGQISFEEKLHEIDRKFRAYTPWPGVFLEDGLKIKAMEPAKDEVGEAGQILLIGKEDVTVGCLQGALKIHTVQPASKKAMDAASYVRGRRLEVGDTLL